MLLVFHALGLHIDTFAAIASRRSLRWQFRDDTGMMLSPALMLCIRTLLGQSQIGRTACLIPQKLANGREASFEGALTVNKSPT